MHQQTTFEPDQNLRSEFGRFLAGRRRRAVRRCAHCGRMFEGIATARYCSAACRQRAYRERNA